MTRIERRFNGKRRRCSFRGQEGPWLDHVRQLGHEVARRHMIRLVRIRTRELRLRCHADRGIAKPLAQPAACVEPAARRRRRWIGNIALQDDAPGGTVRRRRPAPPPPTTGPPSTDAMAARTTHRTSATSTILPRYITATRSAMWRDHGEIMGDEQVGDPELALESLEQVDDLGLDRDVERAYRFVTDNEDRVRRPAPGRCRCAGAARPRIRGDSGSRKSGRAPPRVSRSSIRGARARPSARSWVLRGSASISPTVWRGSSEEYGSWKTIWKRRRWRLQAQIARRASRSTPSRRIEPSRGSMMRTIARPTVVLPNPDSPTSPSVSPRLIVRLTPSTAWTQPVVRRRIPLVTGNQTRRPSTSRWACATAPSAITAGGASRRQTSILRGSTASRRPSPTKLTASTKTTIRMAAGAHCHGSWLKTLIERALLRRLPQLGVGGCTPRPR